MYSENLCHVLLTQSTCHAVLARNQRKAEWTATRLNATEWEAEPCGTALFRIIQYDKKYGHLPTRKDLCDYVDTLIQGKKHPDATERLGKQLAIMDAYVESTQGVISPDTKESILYSNCEPLLDKLFLEVRQECMAGAFRKGILLASGQEQIKENGKERLSTPDDAVQHLYNYSIKTDFRDAQPQPSGILHENADLILAQLDRMEHGGHGGRIKLGFKHIDNHVSFGRQLRPFIGIMGFNKHGKSTVLFTMLYKMACAGHHVCLFTGEANCATVWMHMAFLHSFNEEYADFNLPPLTDFEKNTPEHPTVRPQDFVNLKKIVSDIRTRKGISGLIDVQPLGFWETMVAHMESNQAKNQYEVMAIDYLTRMEIAGGKPQYRNQDMEAYIDKAFNLTRTFDDGKGIMLVTPIQINREGYKASRKKKDGEKKHDATSIHQYSRFGHNLDFCVSIYSDDELRLKNRLLMEPIMTRDAADPPPMELEIDPVSRMVTSPQDPAFESRTRSAVERSPMGKYREKHFDTVDSAWDDPMEKE